LYFAGPLQYTRMEVSLLRASKAVPRIEVPAAREGSSTRIFEIRTYESNNSKTLARKIRMFDEGEIDLFRKIGMHPVFFGETIAGRNMPNLCYMLAYDDLAAREKAWATFVSHPEWKKMSSQPGVSDAEVVSNISNSIVRPLPFSQIK
ncbi:MAG TPA: NIPSNAP family protein, partial [Bryobacteraceae bacterium]|nr:NIPSNAP family protein [Bryobacteraceae bacterium]